MAITHLQAQAPNWASLKTWRTELLCAAPIVALVMYLYYTWFGVLNRYSIFLYFHAMGPGFDTSPFGWVTVSRYWMTGLVAAGAVMVPYLAANFVLGRTVRAYRAPVWWRLWVLCAIPLSIAIPALVMTVNDPVLPLLNAVQVTAVLLVGLALAVALGQYVARHPIGYALLLVDGLALACLLLALRTVEMLPRLQARGSAGAIFMSALVLAAGAGLLVLMTAVYYWWRRAEVPDAAAGLVAGLNSYYLFVPLFHYLFWCKDGGSWRDPDYFSYISTADNYFTRGVLLQIAIWIAVALVALGVTRLRCWLRRGRLAKLAG